MRPEDRLITILNSLRVSAGMTRNQHTRRVKFAEKIASSSEIRNDSVHVYGEFTPQEIEIVRNLCRNFRFPFRYLRLIK